MIGWKKILSLKEKNWIDDETEAERQRGNNYLEWLYRVEIWMSDEKRSSV